MRLTGVHIDGWSDVAVRDWDAEDTDQTGNNFIIIDGGVGSVAVRRQDDQWIGGPQALIAPHGRGRGWGQLGGPDRRVAIRDCYTNLAEGDEVHSAALAAAIDALARHAEAIMFNIADLSSSDEAVQGRLLSVLKQGRRQGGPLPRLVLLWRPVALFLAAFDIGLIAAHELGAEFGFIVHSGEGFEIQTLRLRADQDHFDHFAPEREGPGQLLETPLGLQSLKQQAARQVRQANPVLSEGGLEQERVSLELLTGRTRPGSHHVLRRDNGNWVEIIAPALRAEDLIDRQAATDIGEALCRNGQPKRWFLATPLATHLASELMSHLGAAMGPIVQLDWPALARGALKAGRLIERGRPHCYDRLTAISLAVLRRDEPAFDDLIGSKATVPANKEYVSPPYRDLKWARHKSELDFYVLKGLDEIRHWRAELAAAPDRDVDIELRLRQTPGQSWAKLTLTSPTWEPLQQSPIILDWEMLQPIPKSPAEVLDTLRSPPPVIPERIVESPSIDFWLGTSRIAGLGPELDRMRRNETVDAALLAQLLARSMRDDRRLRRWTVGTDGDLPAGLSPKIEIAFEKAMETLSGQIDRVVRRGRGLETNNEIRALTWTFARCPRPLRAHVLDALEADLANRPHPLLRPTGARKVLTQGAGRILTDSRELARLIDILLRRQSNSDTLNALAMILSRRNDAAKALAPVTVAKIARILQVELRTLAKDRSFKTRFRYCLSALAGLFRYREVEPHALLAASDPEAERLGQALADVEALLDRSSATVPQFSEKRELVASIRDMLDGGGDPDILRRIEAVDDEGDDA